MGPALGAPGEDTGPFSSLKRYALGLVSNFWSLELVSNLAISLHPEKAMPSLKHDLWISSHALRWALKSIPWRHKAHKTELKIKIHCLYWCNWGQQHRSRQVQAQARRSCLLMAIYTSQGCLEQAEHLSHCLCLTYSSIPGCSKAHLLQQHLNNTGLYDLQRGGAFPYSHYDTKSSAL